MSEPNQIVPPDGPAVPPPAADGVPVRPSLPHAPAAPVEPLPPAGPTTATWAAVRSPGSSEPVGYPSAAPAGGAAPAYPTYPPAGAGPAYAVDPAYQGAAASTAAGPYGYYPGGVAPSGAPSASGRAVGHPSSAYGPPSTSGRARRSRRPGPGWAGVIAIAAVAALTASLATAGLTGAFSPGGVGSVTYDSLGGQEITIPVAGSTADNPDWQVVAAAVRESVVAITVTTRTGEGEGSGVVISANGDILTNQHVVTGGENGTITVALADGRLYDATIVGTDETTDIAVIRLVDPPEDLSVATLGDSDEAVVGASVMAVGNPLGLDTTVTTGIISAIDRPVTTQETGSGSMVVTNAIQVDAAINPGNSGGPLFNSAGEVIGITSSIATLSSGSSSSGSIGLGFAIPINQAMLIADQLLVAGTAEHAFLGVTLSDGSASANGTTRRGAVVESVTAGTPAEGAGIQVGDVVVGINGRAVGGAESLTGFVRQHASGDEVTLTIVRDGEAIDVTATLTTKPVEETDSGTTEEGSTVPDNPFGR